MSCKQQCVPCGFNNNLITELVSLLSLTRCFEVLLVLEKGRSQMRRHCM